MGLISDPQSSAYQWQHQQATAEPHMMANQTYQLQSPNHSNYHHMPSPNQQMLLMQPPSSHQNHQQQQQQPQMSPQLAAGGNNYIGQSPPQTARSNENGSTSDDSDDNALNDPNVSTFDVMQMKIKIVRNLVQHITKLIMDLKLSARSFD